jgi:hypothetical protein
MILDATAGNRTMWHTKNVEGIIYLDLERKLEVKPTIFADNSSSPFFDKVFDTIFYDPPHACGAEGWFHSLPDKAQFRFKYPNEKGIPRYYGGDKYKNQMQLIVHIHKAQQEFRRILKDDGLLWLKWNETRITIRRILRLFEYWHILMVLPVNNPKHTHGKQQTYWVCLTKEKREDVQTTLL